MGSYSLWSNTDGSYPDLVVRDKHGEIYTVRYEAVNAMLLNEFLKEHRTVEQQKATIAQLQTADAEQREQIKALATAVKEQAVQIRKVSEQVASSRPAPAAPSSSWTSGPPPPSVTRS